MLYDAAAESGTLSADELRTAYGDEIRRAVDAIGTEPAAEAAGVSGTALSNGVLDLTLEQAVAVLELADGDPDADVIIWELRDHPLMGMMSDILDVDTLAPEVDLDLFGQEIQQAIEGRTAATLNKLAAIHHVIAARNER